MTHLAPLSNMHEIGTIKMMLFAELPDTINRLLSPIRRGNDKGFRVGSPQPHFLKSFRRGFLTKPGLSDFLTMFRGVLPAKPDGAEQFAGFRRGFLAGMVGIATPGGAQFLTGSGRGFHAQARASNAGNIKAALPKGLVSIKPVLFTRGQGHGKNKFDHFKGECIRAILVESMLQYQIAVLVSPKLAKMACFAFAQVDGASNVELAIDRVGNAVDTRRVGYRGHFLTPLVSTLLCVARESRSLLFERGNYSLSRQHAYYTILSEGVKSGC